MRAHNSIAVNKLFFIQSRDNIYRTTNFYRTQVSDNSKRINVSVELTSDEVMVFKDFFSRLNSAAISNHMKNTMGDVISEHELMGSADIRLNAIIMSGILFGEKTRLYKSGTGAGMYHYH